MSIHTNTNFFQFLEFMVGGRGAAGLRLRASHIQGNALPLSHIPISADEEEPCYFPKPLLCYLGSHFCEVVANDPNYMIQKFGEERVKNTSLNLLF